MTYYRRRHYPVDGHADIPSHVWREFQRIRAGLMTIDQNNVLEDGVPRARIVKPTNSTHEGVSDVFAENSSGLGTDPDFLYRTDIGTTTHAKGADDGIWISLSSTGASFITLDGRSRSDAIWVVGASIGFDMATPADRVFADMRINSSQNGVSAGVATGILQASSGEVGISNVASFLVPAGAVSFDLVYRLRWLGTTNTVRKLKSNTWAFGIYR